MANIDNSGDGLLVSEPLMDRILRMLSWFEGGGAGGGGGGVPRGGVPFGSRPFIGLLAEALTAPANPCAPTSALVTPLFFDGVDVRVGTASERVRVYNFDKDLAGSTNYFVIAMPVGPVYVFVWLGCTAGAC